MDSAKKLRVLGLIPARGGSKGVKEKNLALLCGKPLIEYSIDAAFRSKLLTDVIVSTDSQKIRDLAISLGADAPFLRPAELSTDSALSISVARHALEFMDSKLGERYDAIMLLQPTSPLRSATDIDCAISMLSESDCDSLISISDVGGSHPFRMKRVINGYLTNFLEQGFEDMRPRQLLPKVFIRNGAIYLARTDLVMRENSFGGDRTLAYEMPSERSVNIDTELDFAVANHILSSHRPV